MGWRGRVCIIIRCRGRTPAAAFSGVGTMPGAAMVNLDVAGLGFSCLDDLLLLSEIPPPEGRATILRREEHGGGMVAMAMVAAARLGGQAGMVTKVGDDATGRRILAEFERYGVDVSRSVVERGGRSHLTVVLVEQATGARAFLAQRGQLGELRPDELDRAYIAGAQTLHLSDAGPAALQAAQWAAEAGHAVCFDGTHFHSSVFKLMPFLRYLIVSRFFASEFVAHQEGGDVGREARRFAEAQGFATIAIDEPAAARPITTSATSSGELAGPAPSDHTMGTALSDRGAAPVHHGSLEIESLVGEILLDAAERLRRLGPPVVVVTEGAQGCWCASPEESFHTPAYPVTPVDTTGAGDVFHGAFLLAQARGWDLRHSLRLAAAAASLKCRALGGRAGIPTLDEAMRFAGL